jgi:5-carboxymethyl-2-hydroxymuconic-semialdehyde dehydrogenase
MIYALNGERCTSSSRLLVQDTIAEDFCARVAGRAARIRVGHPLDPATEVGPLINRGHFDKVMSYVDLARAEGAVVAEGGTAVPEFGHAVRPTLFTQARPEMRIAQEEIFGPVLTALPFSTEAEAIAIANSTPYGLTGYVWTNDLTRALRVSDALEAGMVWVNSENIRHLPTPFGGVKASGIGRDGGDWSLDFYMETKNTALALGAHPIPRLGA